MPDFVTLPREALADLGNFDALHFLCWLHDKTVDPQGTLSEKEIRELWPRRYSPRWYRQKLRALSQLGYVEQVGPETWKVVPSTWKEPPTPAPLLLILEALAEQRSGLTSAALDKRIADFLQSSGVPSNMTPPAASAKTLRPAPPPLDRVDEVCDPLAPRAPGICTPCALGNHPECMPVYNAAGEQVACPCPCVRGELPGATAPDPATVWKRRCDVCRSEFAGTRVPGTNWVAPPPGWLVRGHHRERGFLVVCSLACAGNADQRTAAELAQATTLQESREQT